MFMFQKLSSKAFRCNQIPTTIGSLSRFRRSVSPNQQNLTFYDYQNYSAETIFELEEESDSFCPSLYFLLDFCHLYYIPSIILLGLVGNLLSCVVFLKTHLKLRSSSYYLAALATTDFSFLMSLLLVWLNSTIGWKVFNNNGWCETLVYVSAVCSSLSVWLIVAFTVERFIAVQYPLHRPHMCTVARAKTIILVLTILALACHSYSFVTAGVVKNQGGDDVCELKIEYLEIMQIISIVDSIASLIVPLVLIIVMNTMIMRNLLKFGRRFHQEPGYTANCSNREKSDINLNQIPVNVRSSCRNLGSRFNQESITKMLVLISTVFILLNLPSYVIRLCVFFFALAKKNTPETLWCLQQFFMLLYYTNFSINFLLYAMCGITFRRCLEQILRRILKSMTRYHCSPQRESVSP
ncbi:hypothetical protein P5V15_010513 [Pogonomyrmex californicus]